MAFFFESLISLIFISFKYDFHFNVERIKIKVKQMRKKRILETCSIEFENKNLLAYWCPCRFCKHTFHMIPLVRKCANQIQPITSKVTEKSTAIHTVEPLYNKTYFHGFRQACTARKDS